MEGPRRKREEVEGVLLAVTSEPRGALLEEVAGVARSVGIRRTLDSKHGSLLFAAHDRIESIVGECKPSASLRFKKALSYV